jgi:hypothetical protein
LPWAWKTVINEAAISICLLVEVPHGWQAKVREAVYYALEAKYFGEQASGVGESTDLFIARPGEKLVQLDDDKTIEEKLIPICYVLSPKVLRPRDRKALNEIPELKSFPKVEEPKKKRKKKPSGVIEIIANIKKPRKKPPKR